MRIGLMSFAHLHAEAYISNLLKMEDVDLVGASDENVERGRYFTDQFNIPLFTTHDALIDAKPDGVIITSENANHLPLVEKAAVAGIHVLCEKPLATNVEDARRIVEVCKKNGVVLMTAFPMRFNPPAVQVKQFIASGGTGTIYGVNSTNQGALPEFHQAENLPFLKRDWFTDPHLAGGGALIDHTVHLADMLRWVLESEVVEVYAQTNDILHGSRVNVETGGLIMLTFANGTFASIDCSWSKPAYYPTWGGLKMELVCEKGLITLDAFRQYLTVYSDKAGRGAFHPWGSDANGAMIADFVAAIREGRQPAVTGEDGLRTAEIVAAAYESARTGQVVKL